MRLSGCIIFTIDLFTGLYSQEAERVTSTRAQNGPVYRTERNTAGAQQLGDQVIRENPASRGTETSASWGIPTTNGP
jgi:hypothetical protein